MKEKKDDIKVSIICTVYNHEKFLRKCLDGLVNQKTNFKYEIIIHDDCSTDNSKKIIKEYEKRYSYINAIYQKENQYSKNVGFVEEKLIPNSNGKYIAYCEGDDYWCDENKIQMQYDFMEEHEDCSMCVHNTIKHDLCTNKNSLFNNWRKEHVMTERDVFFGWHVHTTSFFVRKEYAELPNIFRNYWCGDYVRLTYAFNFGKIICLPKVMSVYNYNNENGITSKILKNDTFNKWKLRADYLEKYNNFTNHKYNEIVNKRINEINLDIIVYKTFSKVWSFKEFQKNKKEIITHSYYKEYYRERTFKDKLKLFIRCKSYILHKIYYNLFKKGKLIDGKK